MTSKECKEQRFEDDEVESTTDTKLSSLPEQPAIVVIVKIRL